jgi:hypothetical protein
MIQGIISQEVQIIEFHRHERLHFYKTLKVVAILNYPSHHKEVRGLDLQLNATYKIMDSFALRPPYSQEESRGCTFDGTFGTSGLSKVRCKVFPLLN